MFDLPHVASRLYGTPLLVARPKLEVILQALGPRLAGEPLAAADSNSAERGQLRITEAGIAVLPIMGTLVRRSSYLSAASGLTSYHDIEADAQEAFVDHCPGSAAATDDSTRCLLAHSSTVSRASSASPCRHASSFCSIPACIYDPL